MKCVACVHRPEDRERVAVLAEKGGVNAVILDSSQVMFWPAKICNCLFACMFISLSIYLSAYESIDVDSLLISVCAELSISRMFVGRLYLPTRNDKACKAGAP